MCCRKISEMVLEEGAPMARPSVWVTVMSCRKWFCCVIDSYQSKSSDFILASVLLRCSILSEICLVCVTGMVEYVFVMSREANMEVGVMWVCCSSWINLVVLKLKVFGSGASCVILEVKCLTSS